jgi:hypothetical protein
MVALAAGSSSRSTETSYQTKITTVMLGQALTANKEPTYNGKAGPVISLARAAGLANSFNPVEKSHDSRCLAGVAKYDVELIGASRIWARARHVVTCPSEIQITLAKRRVYASVETSVGSIINLGCVSLPCQIELRLIHSHWYIASLRQYWTSSIH